MYYPTNNAEQISRIAWRDLRQRPETTVTTHWRSWITHPTTGDTALSIDTEEVFPIKPDADASELVTLFEAATSEEQQNMADAVIAARGASAKVGDLLGLSSAIVGNLKTRDEMEADGWFATEALT